LRDETTDFGRSKRACWSPFAEGNCSQSVQIAVPTRLNPRALASPAPMSSALAATGSNIFCGTHGGRVLSLNEQRRRLVCPQFGVWVGVGFRYPRLRYQAQTSLQELRQAGCSTKHNDTHAILTACMFSDSYLRNVIVFLG